MSVNIKVTRPLGSSLDPDTVNLRPLLGSRVSCCRITALLCIVETDSDDLPPRPTPDEGLPPESHRRSLCTTRDVTKWIEPGHAALGQFRPTVRAHPQESRPTTSLHVARSLRCVITAPPRRSIAGPYARSAGKSHPF